MQPKVSVLDEMQAEAKTPRQFVVAAVSHRGVHQNSVSQSGKAFM